MERVLSFHFVIFFICLKSSAGFAIDGTNLEDGDFTIKQTTNKYVQKILALKNEMVLLQQRVTKLEQNLGSSRKGHVKTADRDDGINESDHILKKRAIRTRRIRRPEVAFQASLTQESATVKLYGTIIFNNVITNIGHAYDEHSGVFTAPLSGTYTFNTNIVSGRGHYVEASIQVNDRVTVSAISDHRLSGDNDYFTTWDQGNAVAILKLNRGDKVSVSVQWPQGSHVIHGVGKSSFSGYLLRSHERRFGIFLN